MWCTDVKRNGVPFIFGHVVWGAAIREYNRFSASMRLTQSLDQKFNLKTCARVSGKIFTNLFVKCPSSESSCTYICKAWRELENYYHFFIHFFASVYPSRHHTGYVYSAAKLSETEWLGLHITLSQLWLSIRWIDCRLAFCPKFNRKRKA